MSDLIRIDQDHDALLVVDVAKTFMPGGGLPVPDGNEVLGDVLWATDFFTKCVALRDLHPRGHISLASSYHDQSPGLITFEQALVEGPGGIYPAPHALFTLEQLRSELRNLEGDRMMLWPDHAIFGTEESELHPFLGSVDFLVVFNKGMDPVVDSYSGFRDNRLRPTGLATLLRSIGVRRVFVVGLAYDFCVGFTAIDAVIEGFEAFIIMNATRAVNIPASGAYPGSLKDIHQKLAAANVQLIQSNQLHLD